jgi:hypothetical protein
MALYHFVSQSTPLEGRIPRPFDGTQVISPDSRHEKTLTTTTGC